MSAHGTCNVSSHLLLHVHSHPVPAVLSHYFLLHVHSHPVPAIDAPPQPPPPPVLRTCCWMLSCSRSVTSFEVCVPIWVLSACISEASSGREDRGGWGGEGAKRDNMSQPAQASNQTVSHAATYSVRQAATHPVRQAATHPVRQAATHPVILFWGGNRCYKPLSNLEVSRARPNNESTM